MTYLPFWAGGLLLASIVVGHWLVLRGMLGVSGRLTVLVNRLRERAAGEPELSEDDLLAAVRAMTAEEFGSEAVDPHASLPPTDEPRAVTAEDTPTSSHALFFAGLSLGGGLAAVLSDAWVVSPTLAGPGFGHWFGQGPVAYAALAIGGVLVRFGTRMGGGCTSGHGLLGLSRLQPGSLLATACFFGSGIAFSLLLEVMR